MNFSWANPIKRDSLFEAPIVLAFQLKNIKITQKCFFFLLFTEDFIFYCYFFETGVKKGGQEGRIMDKKYLFTITNRF